jgi:hypothetical protein
VRAAERNLAFLSRDIRIESKPEELDLSPGLWSAVANPSVGVGTFALSAAVPEPSTWSMMLLGFAGLGFAFRQSRRKVSFA